MLKLKGKTLSIPLIQGGMGVGISLGSLAGAVAACGAMGTVAAVNAGYRASDFWENPTAVNLRELARELKKAKQLAEGKAGLVAANVMVAVRGYAETVQTAIAAGADAIVSGAGLPMELPALAKGSAAAIAPIVSGARAARVICRRWDQTHGVAPDFVVVEGAEAGGHLGFSRTELLEGTARPLEELLGEVHAVLQPYEVKYAREIPVFAAGGVYDGHDMARCMRVGASGVQMATRFIATEECDASAAYKQILLDAKKEQVAIVQSPVGMPGRALRTPLIERVERGERVAPEHCTHCLTPCDPARAPYCINQALGEAAKGNWQEGLFFCGSNVHRLDQVRPVRELIEEIIAQWREDQ